MPPLPTGTPIWYGPKRTPGVSMNVRVQNSPRLYGTMSVLWVAGNRVYESALGSPERARIHSLKVLLVAFVSWVGYGAYLLPFRRESPELAWLYPQHLSYSLNGVAFEEFLVKKPRP